MNEFEEKEYVPTEIISTCGFETDFHRSINGVEWHELLDQSNNEIENYKKALNRIREAEIEVIKCQKHLANKKLFENDIFEIKNLPLSLDPEVVKKYGLLQLSDIFNQKNVDLSVNSLQIGKCEVTSAELELDAGRQDCIIKLSEKSDTFVKKSLTKVEHIQTIMVAEPKILEFHNFELSKTYKKIVLLKNVSLNLARFHLEARPKNSKFSIYLEFKKNQKGTIAPGMSVKIIVVFRTDIFVEPEEEIIVKVQSGKPILIPVRAFRDPPILQGVSTLYHSCFRSDSIITPSTESSSTFIGSEIWTGDEEISEKTKSDLSFSTESSKFESTSTEQIFTTYFECGKCFIGELVVIPTKMRNTGEKGRFFIMSEVDWSSMNIEDVANSNMVLSAPFAVYPAYFLLNHNEEITFYSYFYPSTYGVQVDKLFIISDNCSVQPIEIMGDGIMFEEKFILFNEPIKNESVCGEFEDRFAKYFIELNIRNLKDRVENSFEVFNTSGILLHYSCDQREMNTGNEENNERKCENLSLNDIIIYPRMGIFKPYSITKFHVYAKTEQLVFNEYRTILQLLIEDIPLASISKTLNLRLQASKTKRRMCPVTVDIFIFDIEIRVQNLFTDSTESTEKSFDFDKTEKEDYQVVSPVSEKQSEKNIQIFCCSKDKCNTCSESMTSIKAIINFQNKKSAQSMQCKLSKAEFMIAILKPSRNLYVGMNETFILVLRNISRQQMTFEWGETFGEDKHKLNVFINPKKGFLCAMSIEIIQIFCEPLEPGVISSFGVPCYSANVKNPLTLKIECVVETLSVSFFFSLRNTNIWIPNEELICVNWNYDSDDISSDRKIISYNDILPRENGEKSAPETFNLPDNELSEDYLESITENLSKELLSESSRSLLPFQKNTIQKKPTKKPIIQFFNLSLKVVESRIFLIQNNTPLASSFSIKLRHFFSIEIKDADFNGKNWDEIKQPNSGIVLTTKPSRGEIGPFEMKTIMVLAYADTWGDYVDEVNVNINGLPQFTFQVQVQVKDLPISYPVCRNLAKQTPILKFMKHDITSAIRTLAIENTSRIPIVIHWYSFLIEDNSFSNSMPFKIFLDIFTPFSSFDFLEKSNCQKDNNIERFLRTPLERCESNKSFKELSHFDALTLTPSCGSDRSKSDVNSEKSVKTKTAEHSINFKNFKSKENEEEIELSIIPDYGELDDKIFTINPRLLFIPPKEKRSVTVKFNQETLLKYWNKIRCRALGFIRIAPEHKQDGKSFVRKDGHYLPPTIIDLEVINTRPYLSLFSSKSQKIFKCYANEFGHHSKQITIQRKLFFKNENQEALSISLETSSPFSVNSIITYCGTKLSPNLCVQPGESIEVVITCLMRNKEIDEAVIKNKGNDDWLKSIIGSLLIKYYDGWIQEVELCLQIFLPSLKLSTKFVNFDSVCVGSTKKFILEIENFAVWDQAFEIKRIDNKSEFTICPIKGKLKSRNTNAGRTLKISIIFKPTENKISNETLEIITGIANYGIKFQLYGKGISNENKKTENSSFKAG